jgi:thioredoxin-like negative regulator of GroEL
LTARASGAYPSRMTRTLSLMLLLSTIASAAPAYAGGDWNDKGIKWQTFDAGLEAAKKEKKPICLVLYTEWCPHCSNYSGVFHDPAVVEKSKRFVMVRLDKDKNDALSKKFAPDGEYIPRTYFLSSAGALDASIAAPRDKYRYFYDEKDPKSVLAGMDAALAKLK